MTDRDLTGKTPPHHANALPTGVTGEILHVDMDFYRRHGDALNTGGRR
ncbi:MULTISPECIES: hypothetical protein [Hyphomonas]|nr:MULTISPECIES: hypothetical protein [Hyphomonas]